MKAKCSREIRYPHRHTVRFSEAEEAGLREQATSAGLTLSAYLRRRLFGGRPIMARTDDQTTRELRRIGGLLKHNFETVRATGRREDLEEMNRTLWALRQAIEALIHTA